jgi:hypothetical protein
MRPFQSRGKYIHALYTVRSTIEVTILLPRTLKLNSEGVCVCVYVSTIDAELKRHHSFTDEAPQGSFAPRKYRPRG